MCKVKAVTEAMVDVLDKSTYKVMTAVAEDYVSMEKKLNIVQTDVVDLKQDNAIIKAKVDNIEEKLDYLIKHHIEGRWAWNKVVSSFFTKLGETLIAWSKHTSFWVVMGLIVLFEYGFKSEQVVEVIERCAVILKGN